MVLSGRSVRLRALTPADYAAWLGWINDPAVMDGLDRALPATAEQHERYVRASVTENAKAIWFAVESLEDRHHVGIVWLWEIDWRHRRAEVRILTDPAMQGKGLGKDALATLAGYAFGTLGLHKLYAYVHARNPRSQHAFERASFEREAVLRAEAFSEGAFDDVVRYARFADSVSAQDAR